MAGRGTQQRWRYCQLDRTASGDDASDDAQSENEEEDTFISFTPIETRCDQLYERGLDLSSRGELSDALACFLECLRSMQECQYFVKLPHTLHELAGVYHSLGQYDKAGEFVQAEKLFYEVVMEGDDSSKPVSIGGRGKSRHKSEPEEYGDLLIKKADEFDKLSRVCSRENQLELALDYCGKAVKIRQSVFGSEHPSTHALLEQFTVLYAQVGHEQYATVFHQAMDPVNTHLSKAAESTHSSVDQSDCDTPKCPDNVCSEPTAVPPLNNNGNIPANITSTPAASTNTKTNAEATDKEERKRDNEEPLQEMQMHSNSNKGHDPSLSNEHGMHSLTPTIHTIQKKETGPSSKHDSNPDSKFTQPLQSSTAMQTAKGICPPLWVFLIAVFVQILLVIFLMS